MAQIISAYLWVRTMRFLGAEIKKLLARISVKKQGFWPWLSGFGLPSRTFIREYAEPEFAGAVSARDGLPM
jgi:hypothetical protein